MKAHAVHLAALGALLAAMSSAGCEHALFTSPAPASTSVASGTRPPSAPANPIVLSVQYSVTYVKQMMGVAVGADDTFFVTSTGDLALASKGQTLTSGHVPASQLADLTRILLSPDLAALQPPPPAGEGMYTTITITSLPGGSVVRRLTLWGAIPTAAQPLVQELERLKALVRAG